MATTTRTVLSAPVETPDRVWMDDNRDILILGRMRYSSRSRRWEDHLLSSHLRRLCEEAGPLPTVMWNRGCVTVTLDVASLSLFGGESRLAAVQVYVILSLGAKVPNPQWLDPSKTERSFVDIAMTPEKV